MKKLRSNKSLRENKKSQKQIKIMGKNKKTTMIILKNDQIIKQFDYTENPGYTFIWKRLRKEDIPVSICRQLVKYFV